ncbi:MAG: LysM peptidoglycan-binding domain-containing protein [Candidatus Margulisbacteria bacterium]|nr:LysM peptidoglycan-binding domain-containing protein [Candidatus Margulisiibacteriota bacterium]
MVRVERSQDSDPNGTVASTSSFPLNEEGRYTVKKGDTLFAIARRYLISKGPTAKPKYDEIMNQVYRIATFNDIECIDEISAGASFSLEPEPIAVATKLERNPAVTLGALGLDTIEFPHAGPIQLPKDTGRELANADILVQPMTDAEIDALAENDYVDPSIFDEPRAELVEEKIQLEVEDEITFKPVTEQDLDNTALLAYVADLARVEGLTNLDALDEALKNVTFEKIKPRETPKLKSCSPDSPGCSQKDATGETSTISSDGVTRVTDIWGRTRYIFPRTNIPATGEAEPAIADSESP